MEFMEAMNFRHACKIFDENKKIDESKFTQILEAGRLSPSSLGLEHWDMLLVENRDMRERLRIACWNQPQITTCSHLLVIFAKIEEFRVGSDYIKDMIGRRFDKSAKEHDLYIAKINDFLLNNVGQSEAEIFAWSRAQCYLMAQNMMMAAATLGIDSCPIEGFVVSELDEVLGHDRAKKRVTMLLPFGYRVNEQKPKVRRSLDEILTKI